MKNATFAFLLLLTGAATACTSLDDLDDDAKQGLFVASYQVDYNSPGVEPISIEYDETTAAEGPTLVMLRDKEGVVTVHVNNYVDELPATVPCPALMFAQLHIEAGVTELSADNSSVRVWYDVPPSGQCEHSVGPMDGLEVPGIAANGVLYADEPASTFTLQGHIDADTVFQIYGQFDERLSL